MPNKYVVTVVELFADPTGATIATAELFKQQVEAIDLLKLAVMLNAKPRKVRTPRIAPAK